MENPNYYAIIPANVRYAKITPNAKLLYGEITALCNKEGFCWASNKYFANLYGVTPTSISLWVKELVDCHFVFFTIEKEKGNLRKIYLKNQLPPIKENLNTYLKNLKDPIKENLNTYLKNLKVNNTNNNTNNNTKKEKKFDAEIYLENLDLNQDIKKSLMDWLEIRKAKKTPTTQKSIDLVVKFLNNFDKQTQIKMIENSIINGWTGIFEVKNNSQKLNQNYNQNLKELKEKEGKERLKEEKDPKQEPPKTVVPKTSGSQNGGFINKKELNKTKLEKKSIESSINFKIEKQLSDLTEFLRIKGTPYEMELHLKLNEKVPKDKLESYLDFLLRIKMQKEADDMRLNAFKSVAFYNWYYKEFLGWESVNKSKITEKNFEIIKKSDYKDNQEFETQIEMLKSLNINFKIQNV